MSAYNQTHCLAGQRMMKVKNKESFAFSCKTKAKGDLLTASNLPEQGPIVPNMELIGPESGTRPLDNSFTFPGTGPEKSRAPSNQGHQQNVYPVGRDRPDKSAVLRKRLVRPLPEAA